MGWMKFATFGGGQITGIDWEVSANGEHGGANFSGSVHERGRAGFLLRYTSENGTKWSYCSPLAIARGTSTRPTRLRSDAFRVNDAEVWTLLAHRGYSVWFKVLADGGGGVAHFHLEVRSQNHSGILGRFSNRSIRVGTWNNSRDSTNLGLTGYVDVLTSVSITPDDVWDRAYGDQSRTAALSGGWFAISRGVP
jgi:hypothetical protein